MSCNFKEQRDGNQVKNNTLNESKTCLYGFSGPYCNLECGISYKTPNVKVFGGQAAVNQSWPAYAKIIFIYMFDISLNNGSTIRAQKEAFSCGGTLINQRTSKL